MFSMAVATHIQPTCPTLSESPIDWRMNFELHEGRDNGHSSDGFGSHNSNGRLRFRWSPPQGDTANAATESSPVRELLRRINDLTARIECLEKRLPTHHLTGPVLDADAERAPTQDEFDDPNDVADTEPEQVGREDGGLILADLPRGPLSIDVVAAALGKTVRTLRGWYQVEKYEIPAHKEAGHWRFYRDELMAWYADYEAISRRDAKRAQAKRRKTKHGKQGL